MNELMNVNELLCVSMYACMHDKWLNELINEWTECQMNIKWISKMSNEFKMND